VVEDVSTAQADEYIQMMQQSCFELLVLNRWNHSLEQISDGEANTHAGEKLLRPIAMYTRVVDANFVATRHLGTTHQELFTSWSMQISKH
jgi:hypothetical protein